MDQQPGLRLRVLREGLKLSQSAFARELGVSQGLVSQAEGSQGPSKRLLEKLSARFHVNADWVLYGRGEPYHDAPEGFDGRKTGRRIEPPDLGRPGLGDFAADGEEYALIERMNLSVSAGSGLVPVEGGQRERLAFSATWLARNRINPDLAVLVRVRGDSMAPGIPDGALALVHAAEKAVLQEGVYAFNRGDASYIKRLVPLERGGDGRPRAIVVISDNPSYPREVIEAADLNDLQLVGRVRCVMTTL